MATALAYHTRTLDSLRALLRGSICALAITGSLAAQTDASFRPIFNGRSFAGWEHRDSHWRIEKGAIVGEIPAGEVLRRNLFLFWEGELHDFELRLRYRISGNPSANSGVQFRAQTLPGGGAAGYQADLDDGATWLGRIYDEHGRGLIAERGSEVHIARDGSRRSKVFRDASEYRKLVRSGDWNDYVVRAVGTRMEVSINGERAVVLVDDQPGQQDLSGRLALQLHSGPGPARIEFTEIRLAELGKTAPPPPPASTAPARERPGIVPKGADGSALNLGFEKGSLEGWTASGEAWKGQPIHGDTVTPRRPGQASEHVGEYWLGGYELGGDGHEGTLVSAPFRVTHPWASFLVGGGPHRETRVDIVDAGSGEVIHSASGRELENLAPSVVDLRRHAGKTIRIRVVDEHRGGWGHVNYDDFRFHDELPGELRAAGRPPRVRSNPILKHLRKNPAIPEPRTEAERTVAEMYVPEGFQVELIASEPELRQPIAFTIDERGRLWVAEAFSYPQRQPEGEGKDRIVIFADADADGSFETRRVFIEGLNLVSGLEVGHGGVWVGASPELLFIPDADRDDSPDGDPQVLLDGWGYQDTHETLNSFTWGPDGWLYGNHGVFNSSRVGKPGASDAERVALHAAVWRYHPLRGVFEVFARGGSNQWGLDFNERGELFMTQCRSYWGGGPTTHLVLRGHYWNQANSRHAPFVSGNHPPGLPHLRNFLRASARYGHGEGGAGKRGSRAIYGGHSHVGTMIYLGDNWPASYRDHLFTHNLHGHQINHQVNERRGAGYDTVHAGADVAYVPDPLAIGVDLDYGPDGAVYIIDWYDRQHCHNPHMERWDRSNGRIYRMSWAETYAPRSVDLAGLSDLELASLQTHENAWYARTARRLLQERSTRGEIARPARTELERLLGDRDPVRVLRAMWALHVVDALSRDAVDALLQHEDEHVRAWSIRLATEREPADARRLAAFVARGRDDPSALVRLALASYLADAPGEQAWPIAGALAGHAEDAEDRYLPRMIWYGIAPHVHADLDRSFELASSTRLPQLRDFIHWYACRKPAGLERALASLAGADEARLRRTLRLAAFAIRGSRVEAPPSWAAIAASLYDHADGAIRSAAEELGSSFRDEALLERMRAVVADGAADTARRRRAHEILARAADARSVPAFLRLLNDSELRGAVIPLLARFDDASIAPALIARLEEFSPEDRRRAVAALTSRASHARAFLESIVAGQADRKLLTSFQIRQLGSLGDERVDALVARVWGTARETSAEKRALIERWAKIYREAPLWAYETAGGKKVFDQICSSCHMVGGKSAAGEAATVGPDLAGSGRNGVDYFLENIIDPSAVVGEDFELTVIVMKDGEALSGLVRSETGDELTLRLLEDTRVVRKADILTRKKQTISLMPEGQLEALESSQVLELLKYLASLR